MTEFTYYVTNSSRETSCTVSLKITGSAPSFQGQLYLVKCAGSYANINIPLRSAFHSNSIEKIQSLAMAFLQCRIQGPPQENVRKLERPSSSDPDMYSWEKGGLNLQSGDRNLFCKE